MAKDFRITALQTMWLLTHNDAFLTQFAARIKPELFTNAVERQLVQWSLDHFNEHGQCISEAAIQRKLDDNADELETLGIDDDDFWRLYDDLEAVPRREERVVYRDVEQFISHQGLNVALKQAGTILKDDGPEAAWSFLDSARLGIQTTEIRGSRLLADLDMTLRRIGEKESNLEYISTGLPRLDQMMDGGLRRGELAVFIAPTGRGKTMWLCQCSAMALMMAQTDVVYYTLEVEGDEIFLRTLASGTAAKINDLRLYAQGGRDPDSHRMRASDNGPAELIRKFRRNVQLVGAQDRELFIRDVAIRGANLGTVMTDFERIKREGFDPGLMIIDYADRLQPRGRHERRYEGQEEVYVELALAAKELDVAVWTASQAGRSGLKVAELTTDHIQGAFAKTFEATYVIAAGQSPGMAQMNNEEFRFYMAKARRSGSSGQGFFVKHALSYSRFYADERKRTADEGEYDDDYGEAMSYHHEETEEDEWQGKKGKK